MKTRVAVRWVLISLLLTPPPLAWAQYRVARPINPPALGLGVDTLSTGRWADRSNGPVAIIYHRWAAFLASSAPRYTAPLGVVSPFWSSEEQRRWNAFPIALAFVSPSAVPIILDIRPASPESDSVYLVKTLFQTPGPGGGLLPSALMRVYAVRERGMWVFSNALARTTRDWAHHTVGPFDYVYPAGQRFDIERAQQAARFADSVAKAFALPSVSDISYYLTASPDEMNRIIGLDWYPTLSDGGGFTSVTDRFLVSGNPAQGEDYRHEIVHIVLAPLTERGIHSILSEGVATWLGGTLGMSAGATHRAYAEYLRTHPEVTLNAILTESSDLGFRPAGAIVCEMVYERGGMAALRKLLGSTRTDSQLKSALQTTVHGSWADVEVAWRRTALR